MSEWKDVNNYNSNPEDIMGGLEYRSNQTGKEYTEEEWLKYPGQDIVYGKPSDIETEIKYPLLLLNVSTQLLLDKACNILKVDESFKDFDKFNIKVNIYKTWEDGTASYVGNGLLNHENWLVLDYMKLKPVLYPKKGEKHLVKSGYLFDTCRYNPLILEETSNGTDIPDQTEEKTISDEKDLLNSIYSDKIHSNSEIISDIPDKVETEVEEELDIDNFINNLDIEDFEEKDSDLNEDKTENKEIEVRDNDLKWDTGNNPEETPTPNVEDSKVESKNPFLKSDREINELNIDSLIPDIKFNKD